MLLLPFSRTAPSLTASPPPSRLLKASVLLCLLFFFLEMWAVVLFFQAAFPHANTAEYGSANMLLVNLSLAGSLIGANWLAPWRESSQYFGCYQVLLLVMPFLLALY
jgi:hypothetical protein